MNKYLLLIFCLFITQLVSAQSLIINGNVTVNENSPEGTKIVIAKNGNKISEQIIHKKGHYELKLALGADYKITFEKPGYITKIVSINTEIPEEVLESNPNFPPIKLGISLWPVIEGVDLSVFDQPVSILSYYPEIDDINFDEDYSAKIRPRIIQAEQAIKAKLVAHKAANLEKERKFTEYVQKGEESFTHKAWNEAITSWTQALALKPQNEEIKQKIESARKEAEEEEIRRKQELQNEQTYKFLLSTADSLFTLKKYTDAKEKYIEATKLHSKDNYPTQKIQEITSILTTLAKQEAEQKKQLAILETNYQQAITEADKAFVAKEYHKAITLYRQALDIKATETYPKERISFTEQALAELQKQQAAEAEKQRQEAERINNLKNKYTECIAEADKAFKNGNYSLAKQRYTEAENLNLQEEYPKKQIQEINAIINSSKYKTKLTEYNKNKTLAETNLQQKNYAAAKVYYQKAMTILSVSQDSIPQQITKIDKLIENIRLAEIEKEYKANIQKADKAYQEKAFAVARFYYKKALEIKNTDLYATERLQEIEKNIGQRRTKEADL